jgi:MFS transporter, ACS family, aldohexuronate transporter
MNHAAMQDSRAVPKPPEKQSQGGGRGYSLVIAVLLLSSLCLNYIDRQSLSVLVRFLPTDMKMNNIVYAQVTSAFLLAAALAVFPAGWFIDRVGTRVGLAIAVAVWSMIEILCGAARSVLQMGSYRFLLGIPEAAGIPAVTKAAAEHASPHARAALIGIAMFGIGMGTTFAPPIVAFLTLRSNWRWAFFGTGLMGFAWVLFWLLFYGNRSLPEAVPREQRQQDREPWGQLFSDRRVIGLTLSHVFSASIWWFYLYWIPSFLNQERHLDIHDIGIYGWIPYFFASIGSVWGGYASGRLVRKGYSPLDARRRIMWICAAIVPFTSFVVRAHSLPAVLAILGIATFFIQGFFANLFALPTDLFPSRKVARVVGINVAFNYLMAILVTQFTGYVVEKISYTPAFALVAFFLPLGAIFAQWIIRPEPATAS